MDEVRAVIVMIVATIIVEALLIVKVLPLVLNR
jgi:hypothetical protein